MPLCFAIMPITTPADALARYGGKADHFIKVARHVFKPAAEAAGFDFKAPTSTSAEVIQAEIIANLEHADLVLCDVSTWNANVFFELGIRVALDRPVAMVRDSLTEHLPFDNSIVNTHTYEASLDIDMVEEQIPLLAAFIANAAKQEQNALWKYFGITQRAKQVDVGNPEDAKLELIARQLESLKTNSPEIGRFRQAPDLLTEISASNVRLTAYSDFDYIAFKAAINRLSRICATQKLGSIYLSLLYGPEVMYADLQQHDVTEQTNREIAESLFMSLADVSSVQFTDRFGTPLGTIFRDPDPFAEANATH